MHRHIVIGPPGTGKTTFLKNKVTELVKNNICLPSEIGYFSFTVKAAEEIRDRVAKGSDLSKDELKKEYPYFVRYTLLLINDYSFNNHRSWMNMTIMTSHGSRDMSMLIK